MKQLNKIFIMGTVSGDPKREDRGPTECCSFILNHSEGRNIFKIKVYVWGNLVSTLSLEVEDNAVVLVEGKISGREEKTINASNIIVFGFEETVTSNPNDAPNSSGASLKLTGEE